MRKFKLKTIVVSLFLLAMICLNVIPSHVKNQTAEENAQVANGPCTEQHWGWPFPAYYRYGGGGYISPMTMLISEATPIFSDWHIFSVVMDLVIVLGGTLFLLWFRLPGLPGEGQENIAIIRDADREESEDE